MKNGNGKEKGEMSVRSKTKRIEVTVPILLYQKFKEKREKQGFLADSECIRQLIIKFVNEGEKS